jgi:hypothetical protein
VVAETGPAGCRVPSFVRTAGPAPVPEFARTFTSVGHTIGSLPNTYAVDVVRPRS